MKKYSPSSVSPAKVKMVETYDNNGYIEMAGLPTLCKVSYKYATIDKSDFIVLLPLNRY